MYTEGLTLTNKFGSLGKRPHLYGWQEYLQRSVHLLFLEFTLAE